MIDKTIIDLVVTAAIHASTDDVGNFYEFKIRDVKRVIAGMMGTSLYAVWNSDRCSKNITGEKISSILRTLPEIFKPIYKSQQNRIRGFVVISTQTRGI